MRQPSTLRGPGPKSSKDPGKFDICLRCGNVDLSKKYSLLLLLLLCSSIGFMVIWVGLGARRPSSSRERRANELRVVFYGCENQPADAAAARKISLQCMSVTKHTVQQCHSSRSARQRNCARHSDPFEQRRCSLVHCSLYFLSLARTHTTGTGEQNEKLSAEVEMAD